MAWNKKNHFIDIFLRSDDWLYDSWSESFTHPTLDGTGSAWRLLCPHICGLTDASCSLGTLLGQSSWKPRHRPSMCPGLPHSMAGYHEWASQDDQAEDWLTFMT